MKAEVLYDTHTIAMAKFRTQTKTILQDPNITEAEVRALIVKTLHNPDKLEELQEIIEYCFPQYLGLLKKMLVVL